VGVAFYTRDSLLCSSGPGQPVKLGSGLHGHSSKLTTCRQGSSEIAGSDRNSPSAFDYCYSKLDVVKAYRRRLVGRSRKISASAVRGLPI
jgi:hypothetical protein